MRKVLGSLLLAGLLLGCGSREPVVTEAEPAPVETIWAANAFVNDEGKPICPVMGDIMHTMDDVVGWQEFDGVTYYFCCAGCEMMFEEDPARFAQGRFLAERQVDIATGADQACHTTP